MNCKQMVQAVSDFTSSHRPEIWRAISVAGMQSAGFMAIRITPKAAQKLHERELDLEIRRENGERLPFKEAVKAVWKLYLPSVMLDIVSLGVFVGAESIGAKRRAAMATAISLSETALKDYQSKVLEVVGPAKVEAVNDAVAKEEIKRTPVKSSDVIITGKGSTLFYDPYSDRYFESDIELIRKAVIDLNMQMISESYVTMNDLYYLYGRNSTKTGDCMGWHIDNGSFDVRISAQVADDGRPCLVLDYTIPPRYLEFC